jgi:hypothetical protein
VRGDAGADRCVGGEGLICVENGDIYGFLSLNGFLGKALKGHTFDAQRELLRHFTRARMCPAILSDRSYDDLLVEYKQNTMPDMQEEFVSAKAMAAAATTAAAVNALAKEYENKMVDVEARMKEEYQAQMNELKTNYEMKVKEMEMKLEKIRLMFIDEL